MQLNQIKPKTRNKKKAQVGRGGKRGTYSGRGMKGQKSRAGRKIKPQIRDVIKKLPKKRGYRFSSVRVKPVAVNLSLLNKHFNEGETVTPKLLTKKQLVRKISGRVPMIKLLGSGEVARKLIVADCQLSKLAKEKIEKAGGIIKTSNK